MQALDGAAEFRVSTHRGEAAALPERAVAHGIARTEAQLAFDELRAIAANDVGRFSPTTSGVP